MKIAMVASESNPLVKSGGLADVVYALSRELAVLGDEVCVVIPYYNQVAQNGSFKFRRIGSYNVQMNWRNQEADVYRTYLDGIAFYLIGNNYYFGRDNLYGYADDGERFAFFTLAARSLFQFINFKPDIIHVHDWQPGMLPVLIKELDHFDGFYKNIRFVMTIHNPAFRGVLDRYFLNNFYGLSDELYDNGSTRLDGMVSTLKSGIVYADAITTVSPSHAEELLTPEGSRGLSGVLSLRKSDFVGILNGIDTEEFNPETDQSIAMKYSNATFGPAHLKNRADLLASFGIKDAGGAVYGIVSRLTWQKGIDLVLEEAKKILVRGGNFVVLGTGEYELEKAFEDLKRQFPDTCGVCLHYDGALAHKIYAGSDFFLMPSLFEPCGISQMIAQRYGCLPIVHYTGGLKDTVHGALEGDYKTSDGIGYNDQNSQGLEFACLLSEKLYADKAALAVVVKNAMALDRSWSKSAAAYRDLYASISKNGVI